MTYSCGISPLKAFLRVKASGEGGRGRPLPDRVSWAIFHRRNPRNPSILKGLIPSSTTCQPSTVVAHPAPINREQLARSPALTAGAAAHCVPPKTLPDQSQIRQVL